jgi:hypothetical protein
MHRARREVLHHGLRAATFVAAIFFRPAGLRTATVFFRAAVFLRVALLVRAAALLLLAGIGITFLMWATPVGVKNSDHLVTCGFARSGRRSDRRESSSLKPE